ncbi:hypothetical protein NSQ26_13050 [Bacillus sp. FSL W7-1360]
MKEKLNRLHIWYTSGEGYVHCGPESIRHLYIILLRFGMFVYILSAMNIFYDNLNEDFRFLGILAFLGYFMVGSLIIHIGWRFLNRLTAYIVVNAFVVLWTVLAASLFAFQLAAGHLMLQVVYIVVITIQLTCLFLVLLKSNSEPIVVNKIFKGYAVMGSLLLAYVFIPDIVNSIKQGKHWKDRDYINWNETMFGKEMADIIAGPQIAILCSTIVIGILTWAIIKLSQKWKAVDESTNTPVPGYLLYHAGVMASKQKRKWGYLAKGSKDFPDPVTFLREEGGVRYFKRKVIHGTDEELVVYKGNEAEAGIFLCKVVGSGRAPEYVKVLYGGKKGKWRPYEFEEIVEE